MRRQKITLEAPEPLPFWEAIERLGRAAGLRLRVMPWERYGPRIGTYQFFAGRGGTEYASDDGPFRVLVTAVGTPARPGRQPAEQGWAVKLAVIPEPGLMIRQVGELKLAEVVDDRGRTLLPPGGAAPEGDELDRRLDDRLGGHSGPVGVTLRLDLDRPEPPARRIGRLRGSVPVAVVTRRPDPLAIPLGGSAGRPFQTDELSIIVHEEQEDPVTGAVVEVEVSVAPLRPFDRPWFSRREPRGPDFVSYHGDADDHVELVDADGGELPWNRSRGARSDFRIWRKRLMVDPNAAGADRREWPAPAELRFYDFEQTEVEITFDLRDLPLSYERPNEPPRPAPKRPGEVAAGSRGISR